MSLQAVDNVGSSLEPGDLCTLRCRIVNDAGGIGIVKVQLLLPGDSVRLGGDQTDILTSLDATLLLKD